MNSVSQIKERLRAAISPSFMWSNCYNRRVVHRAWAGERSDHVPGNSQVCECRSFEEGEFIANAPDDIRFLIKEVARLKKELKE